MTDIPTIATNLWTFLTTHPWGLVCLGFLILIGPLTWLASAIDSLTMRDKLKRTGEGYERVAYRLTDRNH